MRFWNGLFVTLLVCGSVQADTISLTNGDRLTGSLTGVSGGKAIFETSYAGSLSIDLGEVAHIVTDQAFDIRTPGGVVYGSFAVGAEGQEIVTSDDRVVSVPAEEIAEASQNRLALVENTHEWSNRADIGLVISNGNSDTRNLNTLVESTYKKALVQHHASLKLANEEAEEETTKDQIDLDYGYKRFISDRWFVAGNAEYFVDELKDIDSRITLGAGAGYQFWDATFSALSAEAGISAVQEDIDGVEENNPAFRVAVDYKRLFLANRLELFHKQSVLFIPDSDRGEVISASTGLRYALSNNIDTIARVDLNHETKPAPGNSKTDATYTLGVGIKF